METWSMRNHHIIIQMPYAQTNQQPGPRILSLPHTESLGALLAKRLRVKCPPAQPGFAPLSTVLERGGVMT